MNEKKEPLKFIRAERKVIFITSGPHKKLSNVCMFAIFYIKIVKNKLKAVKAVLLCTISATP